MKFANLCFNKISTEKNDQYTINYGDILQFFIIDYLYSCMDGVRKEDIVRLQVDEISKYRGEEKLLLPLNWNLFDPKYMNEDKIAIPDKILPVFLAMTLGYQHRDEYFNEYNINYLKRHEPIGCRDEDTKNILEGYGINAYINGCISSLLPQREKLITQNKIYLVDAPRGLKKHIEKLEGDLCFRTQQHYYLIDTLKEEIINDAQNMYNEYVQNARLIITSRLHVASPCMAMGIPVIFAKDSIDERFSWLDRYLKLYNEEEYDFINWNPDVIEYEEKKAEIREFNINRIKAIYYFETEKEKMNKFFETREKATYVSFKNNLFFDFQRTAKFLKREKSTQDLFEYSIWGINSKCDYFVSFMKENYPNAKLVEIVDSFKKIEYEGIKSIKPNEIEYHQNRLYFVLAVGAVNVARKKFLEMGISEKSFCLNGEEYLNTL